MMMMMMVMMMMMMMMVMMMMVMMVMVMMVMVMMVMMMVMMIMMMLLLLLMMMMMMMMMITCLQQFPRIETLCVRCKTPYKSNINDPISTPELSFLEVSFAMAGLFSPARMFLDHYICQNFEESNRFRSCAIRTCDALGSWKILVLRGHRPLILQCFV